MISAETSKEGQCFAFENIIENRCLKKKKKKMGVCHGDFHKHGGLCIKQ